MLGSVERMTAILIEHYAGLWPFWLSPRQVMIVPIKDQVNDYAFEVRDQIHAAGFFVDVDSSGKTMQKKVREAQMDKVTPNPRSPVCGHERARNLFDIALTHPNVAPCIETLS